MAATALGNIPLSTTLYPASDVDTALQALASGVSEEIASAVSTAWKAGGSKAPSDLTSSLLIKANEGKVYNMSASGTTDSNFMEGAGKPYTAGTDIAVINDGTAASPVYKFNVLATQDSSVVKSVNGITPTNGAVTIPNAGASTNGLMSSGDYTKLSGIASGAEVNQNAFAKIAVSGVAGTGDAASETDTLTLVPGDNVTMSRDGKTVTINASVPTGVVQTIVLSGTSGSGTSENFTPDSCGNVDFSGKVVAGISPDSGGEVFPASGLVDMHGSNGVSVVGSGAAVVIDAGEISGAASGAAAAVSGLKNFSKVTVVNSGGTAVTNGTLTPASNADDTLKLQAGSNVTLSVASGTKTVKIDASVPVKDGKIIGGSSLLSGTTIVIPMAGSGTSDQVLGVVSLDDYPNENNTIASGIAVAATPAAVATRVSKSVLDTNVTKVSADTQTPASYDTGNTLPNTIYGLIRAIKITNDTAN